MVSQKKKQLNYTQIINQNRGAASYTALILKQITMTITINQTRYTITKVGYGQYKISDGNITLHTTNSFIKDYIDDEEYPKKQQAAILAVDRMFSEWYEYCN